MGTSPAIALNKVDLPPPFGPTTATFFPFFISKVRRPMQDCFQAEHSNHLKQ